MHFHKYPLARYLLIFVNLSYALLGAAMLAVGLAQKDTISGQLSILKGGVTIWAPVVLICVGTALFIVGIVGSLSTLSENYCALVTFGTVLCCTILVQSVAGAASLFISGCMSSYITNAIRYEIINYENHPYLIDRIQIELSCCGDEGPNDWENVTGCIPNSCCPGNSNSSEEDPSDTTDEDWNNGGWLKVIRHNPHSSGPPPANDKVPYRTLHPDALMKDGGEETIGNAAVTMPTEDDNNDGHFVDAKESSSVDAFTTDNHSTEGRYDEDESINGGLTENYGNSAVTMETGSVRNVRHLVEEGKMEDSDVNDEEDTENTAKPLIDWSDFLFREVEAKDEGRAGSGRSKGVEKRGKDGETDDLAVMERRRRPISRHYVASFCQLEGNTCKRRNSSHPISQDGCTSILVQLASDDALMAGVAVLVMASLQLIGLPLCVFVASVIKENARRADRRNILI